MAPTRPRDEDIASSVSHGIGALCAALGLPLLVVTAARGGSAAAVVGASVFGATLLLAYLASTLYHALPAGRARAVFHVLDHAAIFLLIAGTYTPFTLRVLPGAWGWSLFGVVWALAAAGVVLKALPGPRRPRLSTVLYVALGWLIVVAAGPLVERLPLPGLLWLLAGGLAYTLGALVYSLTQLRWNHFIWHLFVIAGSACHYVAVLRYAV